MSSSEVLNISDSDGGDGSRETKGSGDFLKGINRAQLNELREGSPGCPLYSSPVTHSTELHRGDHVLFQTPQSIPPYRPSFRSGLVLRADDKNIQILSYSKRGIQEESIKFSSSQLLSKVEYTSCRYLSNKAILRAKWRLEARENHYHTLYNNSHYFVTWAKTGVEYPLSEIIDELTFDEDQHYPLNPVLSRVHVTSITDINSGDHIVLGAQHYLVKSVNSDSGSFTVYTTSGKEIVKEEKSFVQCKEISRIDYDHQSNFYTREKAIKMADDELKKKTKWECCDHFVSMMKCGKKHMITDKCLFVGDVKPTSCTAITPHVAVDVGDHLIVRQTFGEYHSVLVYSCVNKHTVISMPSIHERATMGRLNLIDYNEIYRVNYPQSLPIGEILRRCCSPEGEQILMEGGSDSSCFVSWVKTGKQISINLTKLIHKQQIAQIRPFQYEKVLSVDEIQVGNHLFIPNPAYRWHFLVTDKMEVHGIQNGALFKLAYCLHGSIEETEEKIDPAKDDVFRVTYPEEYPTSLAIRRARSLVGKLHFSPSASMWFVRWAKTGSEEGLEVDFLKRLSLPVTKSRIMCFTQLNPGDYLVQERGKFSLRHHYIVVNVESAYACIVIGTWKGKVMESKITLDDSIFHRIIYEDNVCIPAEESLERAREAVGSRFNIIKLSRRKFVNYMKTTDSHEIDVENLPEERLLLKRERVNSGKDLRPGDHIEVQASQKPFYQNMVVTAIFSDEKVRVICVNPQKGKEDLVEIDFDITDGIEIYQVKYLERVNAEEGMAILKKKVEDCKQACDKTVPGESLLMLATVGEPITIQVDPQLHKILQCQKEDVRMPLSANKLQLVSVETGAKASVNIAFKLGEKVAIQSTRLGEVIGFGPGIILLAEAPFLTRRLYKLNRQRKFNRITEEEYKRGVIKESFTSTNTVIGAAAGAIIGQVAIPIPVLGAAVGGAVGSISGNRIGHLEGWAMSKLVRDNKNPTLPLIVSLHFSDLSEN